MKNTKFKKYFFIVVLIIAVFTVLRTFSSGSSGTTDVSAAAILPTAAAETKTAETKEPETGTLETASAQTSAPETAEDVTTAAGNTASETAVTETATQASEASAIRVTEDGRYTSREEVALYIHTYGKLPSNYISKKKAEEKGWDKDDGNFGKVLPGMSIGGSYFGNYEGRLPEAKGRKYYECDIDYDGKKRNAKRIVYSNDGLIFYTEDHYETFEQLY